MPPAHCTGSALSPIHTALPHRITLMQGDITRQYVSAIVNAASSSLLGGDGVDEVIHRAGSPKTLAECQKIHAR